MKMLNITAAATLLLLFNTNATAQTTAVKNAAKAALTLTAYDVDGQQTGTCQGVFTGSTGEAVGLLSPLTGADHATVTDAKGNTMNVTRVIGFNSLYGVAHFRAGEKTTAARVATKAAATGSRLWTADKELQQVKVSSVETFMDEYAYYILETTQDIADGTALVNDDGDVVALAQHSVTGNAIHAVDARFVNELCINAMALNDPTLQKINIAPALPDDPGQAQLMLMVAAQTADSARYAAVVTDFIEQYPNMSDGYVAKAQQLTAAGDFVQADKVMALMVKNTTDKAEAHYRYGRLIYNNVSEGGNTYEPWTLERALDEVRMACSTEPLPIYRHQEAQILFSMEQYDAAKDIFEGLMSTNSFKTAELLYGIARCRQMTGADDEELLALLDSAINLTDTLQIEDAAPYFLMRADVYNKEEKYREAAFDYSRYALLTKQVPPAEFYYIKAQTEVNGKLYQQALNSFAYAILLAPDEPLYLAEMAQLYLRVNQPENALKVAERCMYVAPEYTTGHVLYGLALIKSDRRQEGLDALAKAQEMGDTQAAQLIERYSQGE